MSQLELAFALLYALIEVVYPGSFNLEHSHVYQTEKFYFAAEMVYFSFITLIAIGYGDITPVSDFGQMLTVFEGIVGQFYLAILVSRLVMIYSKRSAEGR